jgi:hypothetical protein
MVGLVRLWLDLFGETQILTVILFVRLVYSNTGYIRQTALEAGKGIG